MNEGKNPRDLASNPRNPRKITEDNLNLLKDSLERLGDLSGVIFNTRTKRFVGGHQRSRSFDETAKIEIINKYPSPTKAGTIAEGYITSFGERFTYREVDWAEDQEALANIRANKPAGDWDFPLLREAFQIFDEKNIPMLATGFSIPEIERIMIPEINFAPGTEGEQGKLDEKQKTKCPECGHEF